MQKQRPTVPNDSHSLEPVSPSFSMSYQERDIYCDLVTKHREGNADLD